MALILICSMVAVAPVCNSAASGGQEGSTSVYGNGITITPAERNNGAVFEVTEKTVSQGENTGKSYVCIEDITSEGWAMLTVTASSDAGLRPNAEYTVTLDVVCDGRAPAYFEQHTGGNDFIISDPGGQIVFTVDTDENGEFRQFWDTIYIQRTGMTVEFTGIHFVENIQSVYGKGITVTPAKRNQQAVFNVTEKIFADGEDAGKSYNCIEGITTQGFSMLTIAATEAAGLVPNTECTVTVDVVLTYTGSSSTFPAYFDNATNDFIIKSDNSGGPITFTITTDENGAFTKKWESVYINTCDMTVAFTDVNIVQNVSSVYETGISVTPEKKTNGALFDVKQRTLTAGENVGKAYTTIENITKDGWSRLTISANESAGLVPNTECTVTVDVVCDGAAPAYFDQNGRGNDFIISNPGGTITFKITTDEDGTFEKIWDTIYINRTGMTVGFTNIVIEQHIYEHANKNHITVSVADDVNNQTMSDNNGFYFTTENDPLAYNSDEGVNYNASSIVAGGVYVDDKLQDVTLLKIASGRYYVALSDSGVVATKGMRVVIYGSYFDQNNVVKFESKPFEFDGTVWKLTGSTSTVIIAGTDFQHPQGDDGGAEEVGNIIEQIKSAGYVEADGFLFGGDYSYNFEGAEIGVTALKNAVLSKYPMLADESMILVQGNHEPDPDTSGLSASGAHDTEAYGVYVINERDYKWKGNDEDIVKDTATALDAYLDSRLEKYNKKPIFVVSHLPLHYTTSTYEIGDGENAKYIFDVLNEHAKAGQNIIFLYGHNHTVDDYMGGSSVYLTKGDTIYIANPDDRTSLPSAYELQFTYMNPGHVGYYNSENADTATTMTVFEITEESVKISRYDSTGIHNLKSEGYWKSDKDKIGANDSYLQTVYESPQILEMSASAITGGDNTGNEDHKGEEIKPDNNGNENIENSNNDAINTGDTKNVLVWLIAVSASIGVFLSGLIYRKKREKNVYFR